MASYRAMMFLSWISKSYAPITIVQQGSAMESNDGVVTLTGVQAKDVIFIFMVNMGSTFTPPSGYTEYQNGVILASPPGYNWRWYYKVMGSTPDTSITVAETNNDGTAFTYYVLRGVNNTTPVLAAANNATLDPPSLTVSTPCLIIASVFGGNSANGTASAAPTGYSNLQWKNATSNNDALVASATKVLTGPTTENPGTFTLSLAYTTADALTVAVNPA